MSLDHYAVEQFLYHEARLMDAHSYDAWFALWAHEGQIVYWVPCDGDDIDPKLNVSIIYDTRTQLRNRIARMHETLWLRERPSRVSRVVSNIQIEAEVADSVAVRSNFILVQLHRHVQQTWAGTTLHKLERAGDSFRIRSKKVLLVNNDEPLPNLMFLV
jgi:benzoate/toluate 1,2-dioxygenase subunit beta